MLLTHKRLGRWGPFESSMRIYKDNINADPQKLDVQIGLKWFSTRSNIRRSDVTSLLPPLPDVM